MEQAPGRTRFGVVPERSAVVIEARSTVGPIAFGAGGIVGDVEAEVVDGTLHPESASAALKLRVDQLQSGNALYDSELARRIDARRFPLATVELGDARRAGVSSRYTVTGAITFHGVSRAMTGSVTAELEEPGRLLVEGDHVIDIRDFELAAPSMLMLQIYPDVRVHLHLEAQATAHVTGSGDAR